MSDSYTEKVYCAGCISIQRNNSYVVSLIENGKRKGKVFPWNENKELAYKDAKKYRTERSTALGLNTVCKWKDISDEKRMYFAGFMDGDGMVSWTKSTVLVAASQSSSTNGPPPILVQMQEIYGGRVSLSKEGNATTKPLYACKIFGKQTLQLLKDVAKFGTIKCDQAQLVLDNYFSEDDGAFIRYIPIGLREEINKKLKKCKELESYQSIIIPKDRLCISYIAGLFDAEGCVIYQRMSIKMTITQKSSPTLLKYLSEKYTGGGVHNKYRAVWSGSNALNVLTLLSPHLIVKKEQVDAVIKYSKKKATHQVARIGCHKRKLSEIQLDDEITNTLKRMKHARTDKSKD